MYYEYVGKILDSFTSSWIIGQIDGWAVYPAGKSDRSRFGYFSFQHIDRPVRVSAGRLTCRTDSWTGICLIPSLKLILNRSFRFAHWPDIGFSRQRNWSEHMLNKIKYRRVSWHILNVKLFSKYRFASCHYLDGIKNR